MTHVALEKAVDNRQANVYDIECRVKSNQVVNIEYRQLILEAPHYIFDCKPGQFFQLMCPNTNEFQPYLRRPMSIYGYYPDCSELHFLYKVTGEGTSAMATLSEGDQFTVLGPLGNGFDIKLTWRNLLLVARGVGLATLAPLALKARKLNCQMTAICSARTDSVLMSVNYFLDLGVRVITVTDELGNSDVGSLRALIDDLISSQGIDAMYTCGSNRLLQLLQSVGREYNIPGQIALEQQMACGIGMCQCCVRAFNRDGRIVNERVCKEGPVFDIQEAIRC